jgi:hypothetical protein
VAFCAAAEKENESTSDPATARMLCSLMRGLYRNPGGHLIQIFLNGKAGSTISTFALNPPPELSTSRGNTKPSDPSKNHEGSATRKFNPKGWRAANPFALFLLTNAFRLMIPLLHVNAE